MMIQMMKVTSLALTLGTGAGFSTTAHTKTSTSLSMAAAFSPDENEDGGRRRRRQRQQVMSKSIPFLPCPGPLVDCTYAGNVGFDPLGFAKNTDILTEYREAEIKHARLAMLAAVGWPASELWDRAIASQFDMDPVLDATGRAPSLLNGGLERVSPIWWGFCIGLTAAIDMYGLAKARRGDTGYEPGMLGFDPLGWYPEDSRGQEWMRQAEIKHGRLAMLVVVFYSWVEWVTRVSVVDALEPISDSVEFFEDAIEEAAFLST